MKDLNKFFQDRFRNQTALQDGFDEAGLWADISKDLQLTKGNSESMPKIKIWTRFTMLILIGVGILSFVFVKNNGEKIAIFSQKADETFVEKNVSIQNKKENSIPNILADRAEDKFSDKQDEGKQKQFKKLNKDSEVALVQAKTISESKPREDQIPVLVESHLETTKNKFNQRNLKAAHPKTVKETSSQVVTSEELGNQDLLHMQKDNGIGPQVKLEKGRVKTLEDLEQAKLFLERVALLVNSPSRISTKERVFKDPGALDPSTVKTTQKNKLRWMVEAFGGLNRTKLDFMEPTLRGESIYRNNYEMPGYGGSYGLKGGLIFKERWTIKSGLELHEQWTLFDYMRVDSVPVIKQDQLTKVWLDKVSRDTLAKEYGPLPLTDVHTTHIKHNNQYRVISIPLEFGFQNRWRKLIYGLHTGMSFDFAQLQKGRLLDDGQSSVFIENEDAYRPIKQSGVSVRAGIHLGYVMGDNWQVFIQPQWAGSSVKEIGSKGSTVKHQRLNLNLGVNRSF